MSEVAAGPHEAMSEVAALASTGSRVRSLTRALTLLQIVALNDEGSLSLADLARHSGLPKPTVHRLAGVLCDSGVLQRDDDGRYLPGTMLLVMGSTYLRKMPLRDASRAALMRLHGVTSQPVFLAVSQTPWVVNIARIETSDQAHVIDYIGSLNPQHTTAAGKVLLAFGDSEGLRSVLSMGLRARTPRSITSCEDLLRELRSVAGQGFATEVEENEVGVVSVAAPIFNHTDRAIAAIGVSAQERTVTPLLMDKWANEVVAAAQRVSADLGWSGRVRGIASTQDHRLRAVMRTVS